MSLGLSIFIIVGTIGSILATLWLIRWSSHQGPADTDNHKELDHRWDGDLVELNNPLPRWWLMLFYITIIFSVGYLILYPGLGNFAGTLGWAQEKQYQDEVQQAAEKYQPLYDQYAAVDVATLMTDPNAMKLGASLFATYCSTCHGSAGRGAKGFPNLTDNDWLYGGSVESIKYTILNGRNSAMPATFGQMLGDAKVRELIKTIKALDADSNEPITDPNFATCMACHGADGRGNIVLGAPNLRDDIWLYGGYDDAIYNTIMNGRNSMMPSHRAILGEERAHILSAYVLSLSQDMAKSGN